MRKWDEVQGKGRTGKIKERKWSCPPRPLLTKTSVLDLMEGKEVGDWLTGWGRVRDRWWERGRKRAEEKMIDKKRIRKWERPGERKKKEYIFTRTHIEKILCHTHTQLKDVRQIQEMLLFQFMHKQGIYFNSNPCCRMLISCKTKHNQMYVCVCLTAYPKANRNPQNSLPVQPGIPLNLSIDVSISSLLPIQGESISHS